MVLVKALCWLDVWCTYSQKGSVSVGSGKIGYIGASPLIFSNSLRFNLLYGNEKELDDNTLLDELKQFNFFKIQKNTI